MWELGERHACGARNGTPFALGLLGRYRRGHVRQPSPAQVVHWFAEPLHNGSNPGEVAKIKGIRRSKKNKNKDKHTFVMCRISKM